MANIFAPNEAQGAKENKNSQINKDLSIGDEQSRGSSADAMPEKPKMSDEKPEEE